MTFFDSTSETGPAPGVSDTRLIITMVEEKAAVVGHDQQHGGASLAHTPKIRTCEAERAYLARPYWARTDPASAVTEIDKLAIDLSMFAFLT